MALSFLDESVSKYTNNKLTTIAANLTITDAAKAMVDCKVDSVLVHENDEIIGIVTEKDVLHDVVARGRDPAKTTLKEITHGPLITIDKESKVREAIELMTKNDIRRLVVRNEGRPIGIISQKLVCGNLQEFDITLPELENPNKVSCPYCSSGFKSKQFLSRHIDDIHIGRGVLEGNLKKG